MLRTLLAAGSLAVTMLAAPVASAAMVATYEAAPVVKNEPGAGLLDQAGELRLDADSTKKPALVRTAHNYCHYDDDGDRHCHSSHRHGRYDVNVNVRRKSSRKRRGSNYKVNVRAPHARVKVRRGSVKVRAPYVSINIGY